jgi:hypothetical protein
MGICALHVHSCSSNRPLLATAAFSYGSTRAAFHQADDPYCWSYHWNFSAQDGILRDTQVSPAMKNAIQSAHILTAPNILFPSVQSKWDHLRSISRCPLMSFRVPYVTGLCHLTPSAWHLQSALWALSRRSSSQHPTRPKTTRKYVTTTRCTRCIMNPCNLVPTFIKRMQQCFVKSLSS